MTLKAERGCLYCAERHPAALDFHHRDKATKSENIARMCDKARTEKAIATEIAKCDVICANCHRKLHYAEGGVSFWHKDVRHKQYVVEEAEQMRVERNRKFPVALKLA